MRVTNKVAREHENFRLNICYAISDFFKDNVNYLHITKVEWEWSDNRIYVMIWMYNSLGLSDVYDLRLFLEMRFQNMVSVEIFDSKFSDFFP